MKQKNFFLLLLFLLFLHLQCSSISTETQWANPRPLEKELTPIPQAVSTIQFTQTENEPKEKLSLSQALSWALLKNPELSTLVQEVRAKEAATLQSSLYPNPSLSLEIEDIAGRESRSGIDGMETTLQFSQAIPLGFRISNQIQVATWEQNLATWDYEQKRLEVLNKVAQAFIEVVEAQERLQLAQEVNRLAQQILQIISVKLEAGKVSPLEATRAKIPFNLSELHYEQAIQHIESAKKRLAIYWGSTQPQFTQVLGDFYQIPSLPKLEQLVPLLKQNPELARFPTEFERQKSVLKLEESKIYPDLTVDAGIRYFNEDDSGALVFGLSIPLPIFDQNQGNILGAQQRFSQLQERSKAVHLKLYTSLLEHYQDLEKNFKGIEILKNKIIPPAEFAFNAAQEGYRQGKFSYLEVLDVQRTLFEIKSQYLEALSLYHKSVIEIEHLISQKLPKAQS